jgi:Family of unknown function (DUF6152)
MCGGSSGFSIAEAKRRYFSMSKKIRFAALGTFLTLGAIPILAHHPFDPEFDWTKSITLKGTVDRVEWKSPHAYVHVDVKNGAATGNWAIELGSPTVLSKYYGWAPNMLKVGEQVTVEGWIARDGRQTVSARSIMLPSGHRMFAASSFFDEPYRASGGKVGTCISNDTCIEVENQVTKR